MRAIQNSVRINMLVVTKVTWPKGFLFGGAGFPFTFLLCTASILLAGPLAYSLDYLLTRRRETMRSTLR